MSDGMLIVRYRSQEKKTSASRMAGANETTARLVLMEMVEEDEQPSA